MRLNNLITNSKQYCVAFNRLQMCSFSLYCRLTSRHQTIAVNCSKLTDRPSVRELTSINTDFANNTSLLDSRPEGR